MGQFLAIEWLGNGLVFPFERYARITIPEILEFRDAFERHHDGFGWRCNQAVFRKIFGPDSDGGFTNDAEATWMDEWCSWLTLEDNPSDSDEDEEGPVDEEEQENPVRAKAHQAGELVLSHKQDTLCILQVLAGLLMVSKASVYAKCKTIFGLFDCDESGVLSGESLHEMISRAITGMCHMVGSPIPSEEALLQTVHCIQEIQRETLKEFVRDSKSVRLFFNGGLRGINRAKKNLTIYDTLVVGSKKDEETAAEHKNKRKRYKPTISSFFSQNQNNPTVLKKVAHKCPASIALDKRFDELTAQLDFHQFADPYAKLWQDRMESRNSLMRGSVVRRPSGFSSSVRNSLNPAEKSFQSLGLNLFVDDMGRQVKPMRKRSGKGGMVKSASLPSLKRNARTSIVAALPSSSGDDKHRRSEGRLSTLARSQTVLPSGHLGGGPQRLRSKQSMLNMRKDNPAPSPKKKKKVRESVLKKRLRQAQSGMNSHTLLPSLMEVEGGEETNREEEVAVVKKKKRTIPRHETIISKELHDSSLFELQEMRRRAQQDQFDIKKSRLGVLVELGTLQMPYHWVLQLLQTAIDPQFARLRDHSRYLVIIDKLIEFVSTCEIKGEEDGDSKIGKKQESVSIHFDLNHIRRIWEIFVRMDHRRSGTVDIQHVGQLLPNSAHNFKLGIGQLDFVGLLRFLYPGTSLQENQRMYTMVAFPEVTFKIVKHLYKIFMKQLPDLSLRMLLEADKEVIANRVNVKQCLDLAYLDPLLRPFVRYCKYPQEKNTTADFIQLIEKYVFVQQTQEGLKKIKMWVKQVYKDRFKVEEDVTETPATRQMRAEYERRKVEHRQENLNELKEKIDTILAVEARKREIQQRKIAHEARMSVLTGKKQTRRATRQFMKRNPPANVQTTPNPVQQQQHTVVINE